MDIFELPVSGRFLPGKTAGSQCVNPGKTKVIGSTNIRLAETNNNEGEGKLSGVQLWMQMLSGVAPTLSTRWWRSSEGKERKTIRKAPVSRNVGVKHLSILFSVYS